MQWPAEHDRDAPAQLWIFRPGHPARVVRRQPESPDRRRRVRSQRCRLHPVHRARISQSRSQRDRRRRLRRRRHRRDRRRRAVRHARRSRRPHSHLERLCDRHGVAARRLARDAVGAIQPHQHPQQRSDQSRRRRLAGRRPRVRPAQSGGRHHLQSGPFRERVCRLQRREPGADVDRARLRRSGAALQAAERDGGRPSAQPGGDPDVRRRAAQRPGPAPPGTSACSGRRTATTFSSSRRRRPVSATSRTSAGRSGRAWRPPCSAA